MKKTITLLTVITMVFSVVGGLFLLDARYTRASKTAEIEQRLDIKIKQDQARGLQQRMWDLQKFYGEEKAKFLIEYKKLHEEREEILRSFDR